MKIKLHTVNVVEIRNGTVESIRSFVESKQGNERAEAEFLRQVRARPDGALYEPEELEVMLDNGEYNDEQGHKIFLVHSV